MEMTHAIRTYALALFALAAAAMPAAAMDKVSFNLAWLPQGSLAGVLVAIDQGYYKEAGLDASAMRGYGGNRTANEIDQGKFEFGYVDPISIALNRANGGKTRLVGAINTRWPGALCYVEQRKKPKDLKDLAGFTLGGGNASPVQNLAPAWLEMNGLPRTHLHMVRMDPAVIDSALIDGKIDLAECWAASNRAVLQKQAKQANVTVGWISYSDYGFDMYGSGIGTSDEVIQKRPDIVRKFVQATYRGYDFVMRNPDKTTDILLKMYPILDRAVTAQQVREIADFLVDRNAPNPQLGWMNPERMEKASAFIDKAFHLDGKVKATALYTNEFIQ